MSNDLFISEILFMIIGTIAFFVCRELYLAKNGMLRKIMIAFFAVEVFVYLFSAVYFWLLEQRQIDMGVGLFRILVLTPKAGIMLWLLWWLKCKK